MSNLEKIIQAFPNFLKDDVLSLLEKVSLKCEYPISQTFDVFFEREKLEIPYRVYFEELGAKNLTETESLILNCLFSRHSNGFIRQKVLEQILLFDEYWTAPFILQLSGEYVREILAIIEENLSDALLDNLVPFIGENPKFFETTKSRITSYWNCYYRNQFPVRENYVGFRILNKITIFTETKLPDTISR